MDKTSHDVQSNICIDQLWCNVSNIFPVLSGYVIEDDIDSQAVTNCSDALNQLGVAESLCELVWLELQSYFRNHIAPLFWSHFKNNSTKSATIVESDLNLQYELFQQFAFAVECLEGNYNKLETILNRMHVIHPQTKYTMDQMRIVLLETLLSQLPTDFYQEVFAFYNVSFKVFVQLSLKENSLGDTDISGKKICNGCNKNTNSCECQALNEVICKTNNSLQRMELLDGIAGHSVTHLVQKCIEEHIKETCYGIFDRSFLRQLEDWLDEVIIKWLLSIFNYENRSPKENDTITTNIQAFKVKLTYFLYENVANSIIDQFFSIIIDFPDSIPAIDDLKICMEKIDLRKHFIKTLTNTLKVRVLHPGVNTMDILTGYIAAIKAIRYLDNSGVILETVTAPIKDYLRRRSDTVRRVVTGLTEEGPTDLTEELAKGDILKENTKLSTCEELRNWENWVPDPFGLDQSVPVQLTNISRSADIISMVVDIYGSKELFMNEYRNLMADRLLTYLDFNADKEIRNLELLKLRFGDSLLHSCEVMLKDVTDSKRINGHIKSDAKYKENKLFDISTLIISAQFWPSFNKESLELPEEIANEFDKYTKAYEAYKGNRTLNWRTVTGRVNLVIEIGGRSIEMTVAPTQAIIIYHFQHKDEWTLEELSHVTKVPCTVLRRRIGFWQTHGLISEICSGTFKLIEEEVNKSQFDNKQLSQVTVSDDDIESAMASASDQREEELQVFWSYIVGMLTNLDSLPIDRIHQMLKLFASHGIGVEFTQDELKNFLQRKVREHKLIYSGGVYQLYK